MHPRDPLPNAAAHRPPSGSASPPLAFRDPGALADFGAAIAGRLRPGEALCLFGPLGAGKSTLARGLVRAVLDDPSAEAPSPTFTLVQDYAGATMTVAHFDLYRLKTAEEAFELGLDEALDTGVAVIEWSERLGDQLPPDRLEVRLTAEPPPGEPAADARWARVAGAGAWTADRVAELRA
jgi:tRNA threonylcarbamoyladenosine biosynthesis protein TsaE